jgi:hypothetical protein
MLAAAMPATYSEAGEVWGRLRPTCPQMAAVRLPSESSATSAHPALLRLACTVFEQEPSE